MWIKLLMLVVVTEEIQAFRLNNYNVLGLDRSESVISINKENAIDSNEQYLCVDVSNQENLNTAFANKNGSLLVYSRFFLHSIDEKIQDTLLMFLKNNLKKNDILALEFHTKEDAEIDKIFGDHYRRYIDAEKFLEQLEKEYHFEINYYIKSRGLSVFKSEDPYLARIIAIKK